MGSLSSKKGVALFIALSTVLIVVVLANIILNIISSQSRLTHHEVSRVRAYYAAQAGMTYAIDQLTRGVWPANSLTNRYFCINGCIDSAPADYSLSDTDIPYKVQVQIYPSSGAGTGNPPTGTIRLDARVDYTYVP